MHLPLVSIIIPAYNSERYLYDTIRSALNQTWLSKEIIVVNDGSTDGSLEIASTFKKNGVIVIDQLNKGASSARNAGIKASRGSLIQFLDADDLLSEDKIEKQVLALKELPYNLAVSSTIHFPENENHLLFSPSVYEENFLFSTDNPLEFLIKLWGGNDFKGSMIQPNAWLTPRSIIDKVGLWDETLSLDDDGEFFARIVLASAGIIKTEGKNYYRKFTFANSSLSGSASLTSYESALKSVLLKKQYILEKTDSEEAKRAIYCLFMNLAIKTFPGLPSIYHIVFDQMKELPLYRYSPILGGEVINIISNTLGWKIARRIQHLYRHV